MILGQWLRVGHVEPSPGQVTASQRLDKRILVHSPPAPDVVEIRARLHRLDKRAIHDPLGRRRQRKAAHDVVHLGKDRCHLVDAHDIVESVDRSAVPSRADNPAPERPQPLGNRFPDRAGSQQQDRLARQLEERWPGLPSAPGMTFLLTVEERERPREGQHERDRMLRHGRGTDTATVRQDGPLLPHHRRDDAFHAGPGNVVPDKPGRRRSHLVAVPRPDRHLGVDDLAPEIVLGRRDDHCGPARLLLRGVDE